MFVKGQQIKSWLFGLRVEANHETEAITIPFLSGFLSGTYSLVDLKTWAKGRSTISTSGLGGNFIRHGMGLRRIEVRKWFASLHFCLFFLGQEGGFPEIVSPLEKGQKKIRVLSL